MRPVAPEFGVRRLRLDFSELPRYWFDGEPFDTHFANALSSIFPPGEAFFVRSVLRYRDRVSDPVLQREIRSFAAQEGEHSHLHKLHTDLLLAQGYGLIGLRNRIMQRVMPVMNRRFPIFALATTAALEHLTAILAHELLARPEAWTARMHPDIAPLWVWHAVEESEHKGVAYDVLQIVSGSYRVRVAALLFATLALSAETFGRLSYMLLKDGLFFRRRTWSRGVRFLFGRDSLLRPLGPPWRSWFRRDFHPWDRDDRPLIAVGLERVAARV